jgi:hypothetical protein
MRRVERGGGGMNWNVYLTFNSVIMELFDLVDENSIVLVRT